MNVSSLCARSSHFSYLLNYHVLCPFVFMLMFYFIVSAHALLQVSLPKLCALQIYMLCLCDHHSDLWCSYLCCSCWAQQGFVRNGLLKSNNGTFFSLKNVCVWHVGDVSRQHAHWYCIWNYDSHSQLLVIHTAAIHYEAKFCQICPWHFTFSRCSPRNLLISS